jgi:ATP-binding cassette, subfamily B, bacterial
MVSMSSPTLGQKLRQTLRLHRAVRMVWKIAPGWTLLNLVWVLAHGCLPLASLYVIKRVIDTVTAGITAADKTAAFGNLWFWILTAGGIALLTLSSRILAEITAEAQSLTVTDAVTDLLHAQSVAVDLAYYENPNYYDTLHRAQQDAAYRPTRIVNGLVQVGQNGLALVGIVMLLGSYNWSLGGMLFALALPGILVRLRHTKNLFGFEQAHTAQERQAWYYHWVMIDSGAAKEIRLFDLGALFQERFRALRKELREGKLRLAWWRARGDLVAQLFSTAVFFGVFALICREAMRGNITLGSLVMYYQGFQSGLSAMQAVLGGLAGLHEDNLFLTHFYQFLELRPAAQKPVCPQPVPAVIQRGITFEGVSFTYPGRSQMAVEKIDFKLAPGEIIAIVGENGSGKTTLIKLLCRLFEPSQGRIMLDGIDIREFDPLTWRRELGVIFQDFVHYYLAAWENIWLGKVQQAPDRTRIREAARQSGVDRMLERLPQGYDTPLGHWFQGGEELSLGEWQKVALARAFLRQARIVILDEPTSSLDPLAEEELFGRFRRLMEGRSAILISHRFSTVQRADRIYVMEQGRMVEQGTHAELLQHQGRYACLYQAQATHYQTAKP